MEDSKENEKPMEDFEESKIKNKKTIPLPTVTPRDKLASFMFTKSTPTMSTEENSNDNSENVKESIDATLDQTESIKSIETNSVSESW